MWAAEGKVEGEVLVKVLKDPLLVGTEVRVEPLRPELCLTLRGHKGLVLIGVQRSATTQHRKNQGSG